jgi:hypothetical protein
LIDDTPELTINAGRIRDESNPFAAKEPELFLEENLDAQLHSRWSALTSTR